MPLYYVFYDAKGAPMGLNEVHALIPAALGTTTLEERTIDTVFDAFTWVLFAHKNLSEIMADSKPEEAVYRIAAFLAAQGITYTTGRRSSTCIASSGGEAGAHPTGEFAAAVTPADNRPGPLLHTR